MKILKVEINRFRAIDKLSLSLLDAFGKTRPTTVIAGPNGSGKTSILFAITNALRGVMGYRTQDVPIPTHDDIRTSAGSGGMWTREKAEAQVVIHLQFDEQEQQAIPELLQRLGFNKPPDLEQGRLTVTWTYPPGYSNDDSRLGWWTASIDPPKPFVRSWLGARKEAIRAWTRREAGITPDYLRRIGGLLLFPQDRNLRERVLPNDADSATTPNGASIESELDDDREPTLAHSRERSVTDILHYFADYAQNRVPPLPDEQNWEKRIQSMFHEVCAPKQYIGYMYRGEDDPVGAPVLQDGDLQYPLANAASGEQVIIEYITRLTHPSPHDHSIILIDEPEIHLHPAWIRKLYLALPRIGDGNQYILTTHSQELRRRAAADNALIDLGDWGDVE